jgi:hypothetical protein
MNRRQALGSAGFLLSGFHLGAKNSGKEFLGWWNRF